MHVVARRLDGRCGCSLAGSGAHVGIVGGTGRAQAVVAHTKVAHWLGKGRTWASAAAQGVRGQRRRRALQREMVGPPVQPASATHAAPSPDERSRSRASGDAVLLVCWTGSRGGNGVRGDEDRHGLLIGVGDARELLIGEDKHHQIDDAEIEDWARREAQASPQLHYGVVDGSSDMFLVREINVQHSYQILSHSK